MSALPLFLDAPGERPPGTASAGLTFAPATPSAPGAVPHGSVSEFDLEGPASTGGIRNNDAIESIAGVPISDRTGLERLAARLRPGDVVVYRVQRDSFTFSNRMGYAAGRQMAKALERAGKDSAAGAGTKSPVTPGPRVSSHHVIVPRDLAVRLRSRGMSAQDVTGLVVYLLAAVAFMAVGFVIFGRRPQDPVAVLFLALAACGAVGHVLDAGSLKWTREMDHGLLPTNGLVPSLFLFAKFTTGVVFLALLLHFALIFPKERPAVRSRPNLLRWIYVLLAGAAVPALTQILAASSLQQHMALVSQATAWIWASGVGIVALLGVVAASRAGSPPAGGRPRLLTRPGLVGLILVLVSALSFVALGHMATGLNENRQSVSVGVAAIFEGLFYVIGVLAVFAVAIGYTVAAVVCLARSYREGGPEAKRQIRWPLWGIAVGLGLPMVIEMIQVILYFANGRVPSGILYAASDLVVILINLVIPASFAIAILKYRLMEIDIVIRRTAVYAALTGLLLTVFAIVVGAVGGVVGQAAHAQSHWPTAFGTVAVALVFVPARNRIQSVMDRRFFRTRYVAAESLQRMSAAISVAAQAPTLLRTAVEEAQQALQSRSAAGFAFHPESRTLAVVETIGLSDERRRELRMVLDDAAVETLRSGAHLETRMSSGGLAALARLADAELLVPIAHRGELRGLLTVGSKLSDQAIETDDREFLAALAAQIGAGLATIEAGARQRELDEARVIQAGLLPASLPEVTGFDLSAYWQPAREVAGDLYDVFPVGGAIALCIADVTGKGMPAALLMSSLQATLRGAASGNLSPGALIARVNHTMSGQMAAGRFVTLFFGVLDPERHVLTYVNAGHNPPMLMGADGSSRGLDVGGLLMGIFPEALYEQAEVALHPGDRLLLYTDGITEAQNAEGELFGEERLEQILRDSTALTAAELRQRIISVVGEFCAGEWQDDATLIVLAVR